jgi:hypothetical protein
MSERQWGVRLADVRLPRAWPLPVIVSLLTARVTERRQLRELQRIGAELGDYVGRATVKPPSARPGSSRSPGR